MYSFVIVRHMHEIYGYRHSTSVLNEYYRKLHVHVLKVDKQCQLKTPIEVYRGNFYITFYRCAIY